MIQQYQPSGRFNAGTFVAALLAAAVLAGVGVVYQLIVEWCPFIYINALLTFGAAFAAALGAGMALRFGKCRNAAIGSLVGLLLGVATIAGSHFWSYKSFANQLASALVEAGEITAEQAVGADKKVPFSVYVETRAEMGWSIGGSSGDGIPISGVFFYLFWLIEAGIVVVGGLFGGLGAAKAPYCERCDSWADEQQTVRMHRIDGADAAEQLKRSENVDQILAKVAEAESEDGVVRWLNYTVDKCPACKQVGWLTVKLHETTTNKKGEEDTNVTEIWQDVELSADHLQQLQREAEQLQSAQAETPEDQPQAGTAQESETPPAA